MGTAQYSFPYAGNQLTINGVVSLQGRSNNGSWLTTLNCSIPATDYSQNNRARGYGAVWGRVGDWFTAFLQAGHDGDGIFALNGADVGLEKNARVVGYKLRTVDFPFIGAASFLFDDTIPLRS